jgi:hypothetical protein
VFQSSQTLTQGNAFGFQIFNKDYLTKKEKKIFSFRFGEPANVARTVIQYARAGMAALHIESQSGSDQTTLWSPNGQTSCLPGRILDQNPSVERQ